MQKLTTKRLLLRPFSEGDLEEFHHYAKNPHVGPSAGWKPHGSMEESYDILKSFIEKDEVWALEHRETGRLIGSVGLHEDQKRGNPACRMMGYGLDEAYWGQGLMPEAVRAALSFAFFGLELELVSIYHYPFNHRSQRVIEKCGFQYEGTLRMSTKRFDGALLDDVCYSMTKSEFLFGPLSR